EGRIVVEMVPGVGQDPVRLDLKHLAIEHAAPVAGKVEPVPDYGREIALHQPRLDQMRERQRAPELLRRTGQLALDDDRAGLGGGLTHWSILLSKSSSRSSRSFQ